MQNIHCGFSKKNLSEAVLKTTNNVGIGSKENSLRQPFLSIGSKTGLVAVVLYVPTT